jgi:uncharacterized protein YukE
MGLVGADVDQMHTLARTLTNAAERLESTTATVSGSLSAVPWSGPDAERYRAQWHGESRATMRSVIAALQEAANTVSRNAAEQEKASAPTGSAGPLFSGVAQPPAISNILPGGFDGQPFNPLVGIRDFLGSNAAWPITWGTLLGPLDDYGVLPLLDALGLASDSSMSDQAKIIAAGNSLTDLAGGLAKGKGGPIGYLGGVAIQQWGDVAAQVTQADFSSSGVETVTNYIASDPGGAFNAAKHAVVGYVPKLFSNLLPW